MTLYIYMYISIISDMLHLGNKIITLTNHIFLLCAMYITELYTVHLLITLVVVIFSHSGSLSPYDVTANTQHVYVVLA